MDLKPKKKQRPSDPEEVVDDNGEDRSTFRWEPAPSGEKSERDLPPEEKVQSNEETRPALGWSLTSSREERKRTLEAKLLVLQEEYEQNQKAFKEAMAEQKRTGATGFEDYWIEKTGYLLKKGGKLGAEINEIEKEMATFEQN